MSWNKLSMRERADIMKLAIDNGIYDLDTIRGAYNEFASGGNIHIKPSHRGRLTELKERTGKSEAELYNDGNPAHKKMVVFARNARKWKHGLGGHIFDGTSENSQQMYTLAPWQESDWVDDDIAQKFEEIRHPYEHNMKQLVVSAPYLSDAQRMKADHCT